MIARLWSSTTSAMILGDPLEFDMPRVDWQGGVAGVRHTLLGDLMSHADLTDVPPLPSSRS